MFSNSHACTRLGINKMFACDTHSKQLEVRALSVSAFVDDGANWTVFESYEKETFGRPSR